jgi:hypothetical protein
LSNSTPSRTAFAVAIAEKPGGRFMIRNRSVLKRHPEGDGKSGSVAVDIDHFAQFWAKWLSMAQSSNGVTGFDA